MKHALILAAHGSHLDAHSSATAWGLADGVRSLGEFDVVRAAFWKEEPSFARALDGLEHHAVTVVPLFMAPGYFTKVALPRELAPAIAARPGEAPGVRVLGALGCEPPLAHMAAARAREAGAGEATTVVLLGHGTERHGGAAANLTRVAQTVAETVCFAHVVPAFIDQAPDIADVLRGLPGPVVVVPYFMSEGWHTGTTVPADLARAGISVQVTPPVGTHPGLAAALANLLQNGPL